MKYTKSLFKLTSKQYDLIGPPDKISNIRKYKIAIPENESKYELQYRLAREKLDEFNHQYWSQQNLKYNFERQKYLKSIKSLNIKNNETTNELDSNLMSTFYKNYLDDSFITHYNYNRQWYSYNFQLLLPALKVFLYRLLFSNKKS